MLLRENGLKLVTLHDRPEGSALGSYYYLIEAEDPSGITEEQLAELNYRENLRFLGTFDSFEKIVSQGETEESQEAAA